MGRMVDIKGFNWEIGGWKYRVEDGGDSAGVEGDDYCCCTELA